ncbi:MAG: sigma-54 dependent transcriptional regulator [bacterium]|jgi:DNA-binding NtrC family response regulator|nr:sigma-54 dependent transcriptional regulator [candidate division KSB1 bacterium]MDH7559369.1 sigma-54 dependent transcriptional regulator [bacterium]
MAKLSVLIVEDDPLGGRFVRDAIQRLGYDVTLVHDGATALELAGKQSFALVLTDLKMEGVNGMDVLCGVKRLHPETEVVIMTAYGTIDNAVEAMKKGAFDYITKPIAPEELRLVVERVQERQQLVAENRFLRAELQKQQAVSTLLGSSLAMQRIRETVQMVAPTSAAVLIEGETGTGKEVVANAIELASPRHGKPFVKVNCGALPHTLLESELFGHERGAFTGAVAQVKGRFELADGGTLLLDEIADLDKSMQVKLLRVLQFGEFERIGSGRTLQTDVRIIATTNRNLLEEVKRDRFRKDLYFRLNTLCIRIPPLRERPEDIPVLAEHFLAGFVARNGERKRLSSEAMRLLMEHNWPGNVRELESAIERAAVLSRGTETLTAEHFPYIREHAELLEQVEGPAQPVRLEDVEREHILTTLRRLNGNKSQTARLLGITVKTLRAKLRQYGVIE